MKITPQVWFGADVLATREPARKGAPYYRDPSIWSGLGVPDQRPARQPVPFNPVVAILSAVIVAVVALPVLWVLHFLL